eukprot:m.97012 g.97012  ORF g.97012 m.97012 type:complete len:458 (-) comp16681_c0_seq1:127-1500(-)
MGGTETTSLLAHFLPLTRGSQSSTKGSTTRMKRQSSGSKLACSLTKKKGSAIHRELSQYERVEASQYPEVYFVPKTNFPAVGTKNKAFDDENSRYLTTLGDHIAYRYEVQSKLGKGAFGDVYLVYDHKTSSRCALKIIRNEHRFHVQGRIEVKVLESLQDQSDRYCCVKMLDSFTFRSHLCLTFELHSHDLYTELKSREFVGLSVNEVRTMVASITSCLKVLKERKIVHADLKPENILLLDEDSRDVKVIDFGSSCYEHTRIHTYVQSRYYRAPEIVLGAGYGCPVDMWSLGCIIVELLTGRPLFAAKNERDLLLYMMELLDMPPPTMLRRSERSKDFFYTSGEEQIEYHLLRVVDRKGRRRDPNTRSLASCFGKACTDESLLDFVRQCLVWDPSDRLTPQAALQHPFLQPRDSLSPLCKRRLTVAQRGSEHMGSTLSLDDSGLESGTSSLSMSSDE